jgi:hypothetical protein
LGALGNAAKKAGSSGPGCGQILAVLRALLGSPSFFFREKENVHASVQRPCPRPRTPARTDAVDPAPVLAGAGEADQTPASRLLDDSELIPAKPLAPRTFSTKRRRSVFNEPVWRQSSDWEKGTISTKRLATSALAQEPHDKRLVVLNPSIMRAKV